MHACIVPIDRGLLGGRTQRLTAWSALARHINERSPAQAPGRCIIYYDTVLSQTTVNGTSVTPLFMSLCAFVFVWLDSYGIWMLSTCPL